MQTSSSLARRTWDWPAAILVFLLLQVAAARLVITGWTPFLFFTQTLSAFSVALGLALGYSIFRPRTVRWLVFFYSLVLLPWQLTLAVEAEAPFAERLASIGGRMWFSLIAFATRKPVDDALFFVAFVSLAYWIVGLTAGYALARHGNYLVAVLPAGLITLFVQLYDSYISVRIWGFGIYIFVALLLLGRMYFNHNHLAWNQKRIFVTSESAQDLANSLLTIAAVTVFVAWSLPTSLSNLQSAGQAWDKFTRPIRERLTNAVTALESPYGSGNGTGDFYGSKLALGRNASLGDTPVFTVKLINVIENAPPRYYWRGRVYDTYIKGQWTNGTVLSQDFVPNREQLVLPETSGQKEEARFNFTMLLSKQGLLYTPSEPFWVNRPSNFFAAPTSDEKQDVSAWVAEPALSGGDRYQVRAWIGNPSIEELQAAGTEYPEWVADRYLQIPENLAARLQPLGENITEGKDTPYDKAQAITIYLRDEIEYSTSLAPPPQGVDPLLWVLFDYKKGFCMYYASAEVMILRSLGIPARMVVGFSQGEADDQTHIFTVRKVNAHAWPEVYFPEIGWVEFEPTGNQDPLVRPTSPPPTPSASDALVLPVKPLAQEDSAIREPRIDESGVTEAPPFSQTTLGRALFLGLGLLVAAALLLVNRRYGLTDRLPVYISDVYTRNGSPLPAWVDRWVRWTHLTSIERSFHAVNFSLRWMGKPQLMYITPAERARLLKEILPTAHLSIDMLLSEHQAALFSPRPGNPAQARRAALTVLALTLRTRLLQMLRDLRHRMDLFFG